MKTAFTLLILIFLTSCVLTPVQYESGSRSPNSANLRMHYYHQYPMHRYHYFR